MIIRTIEKNDIPEIVKLHKLVFSKDHFSSIFPSKLLVKYFITLYKHHKFKFVAVENLNILGYLIGGFNPEIPVNNFLRKHLLSIIFILIMNPKFLLEKIHGFVSSIFSNQVNVHKNSVSIYLIAVSNTVQKRGIGKELLNHFEQKLLANKISSYTLAVRIDNFNAIEFYKKNNFTQIDQDYKTLSFKKNLL